MFFMFKKKPYREKLAKYLIENTMYDQRPEINTIYHRDMIELVSNSPTTIKLEGKNHQSQYTCKFTIGFDDHNVYTHMGVESNCDIDRIIFDHFYQIQCDWWNGLTGDLAKDWMLIYNINVDMIKQFKVMIQEGSFETFINSSYYELNSNNYNKE